MNVLRSSYNHYNAGAYTVTLDLSHLNQGGIELFYSWVEIWLFRNCKSGWSMETIDQPCHYLDRHKTLLQIKFDDPREALYFKLSPECSKGHISPAICYVLSEQHTNYF